METLYDFPSFVPLFTDRLKIEYITTKYLQEIFSEKNNPSVNTYLARKSASTIEELSTRVTGVIESNKKKEVIQLEISSKENDEFIGLCVIKNLNSGFPEIGIWTKESSWGKGYGKEIVQGLVSWIQNNLPHEYIIYETFKENVGSVRIVEGLGGVLQDGSEVKKNYFGEEMDHVQYRIFNNNNKPQKMLKRY